MLGLAQMFGTKYRHDVVLYYHQTSYETRMFILTCDKSFNCICPFQIHNSVIKHMRAFNAHRYSLQMQFTRMLAGALLIFMFFICVHYDFSVTRVVSDHRLSDIQQQNTRYIPEIFNINAPRRVIDDQKDR